MMLVFNSPAKRHFPRDGSLWQQWQRVKCKCEFGDNLSRYKLFTVSATDACLKSPLSSLTNALLSSFTCK